MLNLVGLMMYYCADIRRTMYILNYQYMYILLILECVRQFDPDPLGHAKHYRLSFILTFL